MHEKPVRGGAAVDAEFSDRLMFTLLLHELGAKQEARESWARLSQERADLPELFRKLKTLPGVGAIMLKRAAIDSFYNTIGEQMLIYTGIFALFAIPVGILLSKRQERKQTQAEKAAFGRLGLDWEQRARS